MKQKTIIKTLMAVSCTALLLASGCGKETSEQKKQTNLKTETMQGRTSTAQCIPCNNKNPYDQVGVRHNELLAAVHEYSKETGDTSRKGKAVFLSGYVHENYGTNIKLSPYPEEEGKIIKDYRSALATMPLSDNAKTFVERFSKILESIKAVSWEEYRTFKDAILRLEHELQHSELAEKEKQLLLAFSSILRHSGWYWFEKAISSDIYPVYPFRDGLAYPMGFFRKLGGVLACIAGDATTLAWHYVRNSPIDHAIAESAWMSEVCGYYTGWY